MLKSVNNLENVEKGKQPEEKENAQDYFLKAWNTES